MSKGERKAADAPLTVTLRVREFGIPPVHDGLVIGRKAPIGRIAMQKALALLHASPFDHVELADDVIQDILVRSNILLRVPRERLVEFVLRRVKPVMAAGEIIHLAIEAELRLEDQM